jgi:hypothetical protein
MDAEAVARLMAAQDAEPDAETPVPSPAPEPIQPSVPAFDPGKIDGRTLRRTGREPFATRIKPETHEALRRIAYKRRITIAEAVEMAVAAFDSD